MRYIDIPAKVIECIVTTAEGAGAWPFDDGTNDPFWQGGPQPRDYRWKLNLIVSPQNHSNHKTRKPFTFNGMDVKVGDYITNSVDGIALKIVSIENKTDTSVTCVVEDTFRYNTFRFPGQSGVGLFGIPANAIIFELNEEGLPVVDPIPPSGVGTSFFANLMSRFNNLEKNSNFLIEKSDHGFVPDQLIAADPGGDTFVLADAAHPFIVGVVSFTDIGPNAFMINPIQKVLDNFDSLIGEVGDVLYSDPFNPGGLTTESGSRPVMIKLRDFTNSFIQSTISDGATTPGSKFEINDVLIEVGGTGSADDFVDAVNAFTGSHSITATAASAPVKAETSLSLIYGEPALVVPTAGPYPTATINGVLVTFSINANGLATYGAEYALEQDLAASINAAAIPGIEATTDSNKLIITNTNGGPITIVNGDADSSGAFFAGDNSGSGIPLSTAGGGSKVVRLDAPDARPINLFEVEGTPCADFGVFSVENGQKAAALYIEQGLRTASNYVVPTIISRDAINAMIGDQAYVLDKGDGQWGLYLYDQSGWRNIANYESAKVDSDVLTGVITTSSPIADTIATINDGSRVNVITVTVEEAFDGNASITFGDSTDSASLMSADQSDLSQTGTYEATPTKVYSTGGADVSLVYALAAPVSTRGRLRWAISYN